MEIRETQIEDILISSHALMQKTLGLEETKKTARETKYENYYN